MKKLLMVLLMIALTGCATASWMKVKPEEYKDHTRKFSAVLPAGWMFFNTDKVFVTTKDGIALDVIKVERVRFTDKLSSTKKKFKPSMLPDELANVEIDNYQSAQGNQKFEVISNESVDFAGQQAFRLAYRYQTTGGLWEKGIHYGFVYDDVVYRVIFEAAEQYYYKDNESAFEGFIKTYRNL